MTIARDLTTSLYSLSASDSETDGAAHAEGHVAAAPAAVIVRIRSAAPPSANQPSAPE